MMKTAFVLAAATAVLTTSPPATPAKAQDLKMAQGVDIQIGVGPGGVSIGPRHRCRTVTTTIERGNRTITRRERRCD
jgi:hypothetical protein